MRDAALLDLVSVERHSDYLRDVPPPGRLRESHMASYRRECLTQALQLRDLLTVPAAVEMYLQRMPKLAAWLDEQPDNLVPPDWRRLVEVVEIESGVSRLLSGEDPAAVRAEMPAGGLPTRSTGDCSAPSSPEATTGSWN